MATNDQHALNVAFAAVCHPFMCTAGDEFLSLLRLLCKDSRLAADAERKRVKVCLPDTASDLHPSPEHLRCLLSRLPALAHVSISQDPSPPEPSRSRDPGSRPSGSPHNPHASAPRLQQPPPTPTPLPPGGSYWRTALSALRPQHLRSLQLDGLVLLMLPPRLWTMPGTGAPEPGLLGNTSHPCGGVHSRGASYPLRPLCPSSPSPGTGPGTGPGPRWSDSPELLSDLLAAAPGLQELSLQRVRVRVLRETPIAGAGAEGADGIEAGGESMKAAVDAAAAWCPVLAALPPGLTALRLSLSLDLGLSTPRVVPPGGGGSVAAAAGGRWCHQSCPCRCPCPGCLGDALRRLPRLATLELSGMAPADVMAALTAATRASGGGGNGGGPEGSPLEFHVEPRGKSAAAVVGKSAARPSPSSAAAAATASAAPSAAGAQERRGGHGQCGRDEQRRQEQPQPQLQPLPGPSLARLERLVLDLEGHADMQALREVVAGLPQLTHLVLAERAVAPPVEDEEAAQEEAAAAGAVRRAPAAAVLPAGGASPGPGARPAGVIPVVAELGCASGDVSCSLPSDTTGGMPAGLMAAGYDGAPGSPGPLPPGAATTTTASGEAAISSPLSPPQPRLKDPPAPRSVPPQWQPQRQQSQQHQQQPLLSLCPLDAMLWMLRRPELRCLSFTSDRSFTTLEPRHRAAAAPTAAAAAAAPPAPPRCFRATAAASSVRDVAAAAGQHVGLWRPDGAVRSNADGGTLGTLALGGDGCGGASSGGSGVGGSGAGGSGSSSGGGPCLSSVRLSFDLSAEALETLVANLPYTVTSLTLHVGMLHRPADVLAAYFIAADERARKEEAEAAEARAVEGEAAEAEARAAAGRDEAAVAEVAPRSLRIPSSVCNGVPSASPCHQTGGRPSPTVAATATATGTPPSSAAPSTATPSHYTPGASSLSAPPPPQPASPRPSSSPLGLTTASASATSSSLPSGPDSPAWLSIPPHSFLGGMRFLWPALTQLPRVVPRLRELRLGGGAAAACSDHVLRCWAGASGDPDSLATPMVVDPSFNAMMRVPRPDPQPVRQGPVPGGPGGRAGGGRGGEEGRGGAGPRGVDEGVRSAERAAAEEEEGVAGLGREQGERLEGRGPEGAVATGGLRGGGVAMAGGQRGSGQGVQGGGGISWSEWSRSLERVCLMASGPTVAGALHLRRFMTGLRRLQVVVDGRLTDVAVAAGGDASGGGR